MSTRTAIPSVPLPDAATVLAACRDAVTAAYPTEQTLITDAAAAASTSAGVRVRFTTDAARYTAQYRLDRLGYAVRQDSRPIHDEHGDALLVTGWDDRALAERAARAEVAVDALRNEHDLVASDALANYRSDVDTLHQPRGKARAQVILEQRGQATRRLARVSLSHSRAHVTASLASVDLRTAPEPTRGFLVRIAVAQVTLAKLADAFGETVAGVVDLYEENRVRHAHPDAEAAAAAALLGVADANAALLELALTDYDGPRPDPSALAYPPDSPVHQ